MHAFAINICVGERRLARIAMASAPDGVTPGLLVIGQAEIEARLRARLAALGCEVAWGSELAGIDHGTLRSTRRYDRKTVKPS